MSRDPAVGATIHPRLRVALVTETFPPEVNGVAMTLGRLVAGLRCRDHSVEIVRPQQSGDGKRGSVRDEITVGGLPIPNYRGLRFGLPATGFLLKRWRQNPPDIVHVATEGFLGASALKAARILGLPVSSTFHTNFAAYCRHYGLAWLKTPVLRYLRRFHNRCDATLVPTHAMARELSEQGYRNVGVIARGVDTRLFNPARRSEALRTSWGVQSGGLVVAYVGRIAAEKNLQVVLAAFAAIRSQVPQAILVFVGDGPMRKSLAAHHPEHVYAGMRHGEDLAAHYASADLFLFPSLTETFGNVTLEAMASGLAVVAFDQAAAGDLIRNGEDGRIVPAGDQQAFVEAAVELASAPETHVRLRRAAAETASHLGWEHVEEHFVSLLRETIQRERHLNPAYGTLGIAAE